LIRKLADTHAVLVIEHDIDRVLALFVSQLTSYRALPGGSR
jgi:ABC-type uncharacterized transport system ATPase subunit